MFNTKYYNNLGTSFTEREIPVWNGELLGDIMQALVFRGNSVKLMRCWMHLIFELGWEIPWNEGWLDADAVFATKFV